MSFLSNLSYQPAKSLGFAGLPNHEGSGWETPSTLASTLRSTIFQFNLFFSLLYVTFLYDVQIDLLRCEKFMCGLGPGIALGSTRVYGEIRDTRVYISPVLLPLCARVSPTNRYANVRGKVGSIMCSLTQSIHFLSYLVFSNQIFQFCSLDFD